MVAYDCQLATCNRCAALCAKSSDLHIAIVNVDSGS